MRDLRAELPYFLPSILSSNPPGSTFRASQPSHSWHRVTVQMGKGPGRALPKFQILRIALIASCVGAFELTHANPRMRLQRRAAIALNARPLIMGQPDEISDEVDEPPLPEEHGPYLTIKGKGVNAFGALYGVQSVLLLGPLWRDRSVESGQPAPDRFGQTPTALTWKAQGLHRLSAGAWWFCGRRPAEIAPVTAVGGGWQSSAPRDSPSHS